MYNHGTRNPDDDDEDHEYIELTTRPAAVSLTAGPWMMVFSTVPAGDVSVGRYLVIANNRKCWSIYRILLSRQSLGINHWNCNIPRIRLSRPIVEIDRHGRTCHVHGHRRQSRTTAAAAEWADGSASRNSLTRATTTPPRPGPTATPAQERLAAHLVHRQRGNTQYTHDEVNIFEKMP